jgi:hypothetical protein
MEVKFDADIRPYLKRENFIGAGGFGEVYRIPWRGVDVAVKVGPLPLPLPCCLGPGRVTVAPLPLPLRSDRLNRALGLFVGLHARLLRPFR